MWHDGRMVGRPATGKTPLRNIRVPDDLWDAAKQKAQAEGTTLTEVIKRALTRYVTAPSRKGTSDG